MQIVSVDIICIIAVLKYKKIDEDESLKEKFSRLNIHSISKKSKRVTSHLKILTGGEPQVGSGPVFFSLRHL